jgi:hypothetical protein
MRKQSMKIRPTFPLLLALVATLFSEQSVSESLLLDPQRALAAHNSVRSLLNSGAYSGQPIPVPALPRMSWDQGLAVSAQAQANTCRWQHSSDRINTGENLYATTFPAVDVEAAVAAWADEYRYYSFENDSCQPGEQCGHYTQLVWEDSLRVGCAAARCAPLLNANGSTLFSSAVVTTCQYQTAGNYRGVRPYATDGSSLGSATYDGSAQQLDLPYFLVHYPDNLVVPYRVRLQLTETDPVLFTVIDLQRIDYQDLDHVVRYDVHTSRLFLPHVAVVNGTITSQHSAVLELAAGDGITLRLLSID